MKIKVLETGKNENTLSSDLGLGHFTSELGLGHYTPDLGLGHLTDKVEEITK